jgi:gamma-glutamylcyclotransferase (GGCT)/AIG2-like uncharacterized protein YtfP
LGHRLFAYGTLRAPEVMRAVAGRGFEHREASLPAHAAYRVLAEDFPGLVPERRGRAAGTLWWGLDERALRRLDRFEGELYVRKRVRVDTDSGRCMAWVYLLRPLYHGRLSAQPWDYGRFRKDAMVRYLGSGRRPG